MTQFVALKLDDDYIVSVGNKFRSLDKRDIGTRTVLAIRGHKAQLSGPRKTWIALTRLVNKSLFQRA